MQTKKIIFTVTNDLSFDQRMMRICQSLSEGGYGVMLAGVKREKSIPLQSRNYQQKRTPVFFEKGFLFYMEYNIRLFIFLLFQRCDAFCCIDLDTMLPVYLASIFRGKTRIYDAHEFFTQQKEIVSRPKIYNVWHFIERNFLPKFVFGYTVNQSIADIFKKEYGVHYAVMRNVPVLQEKVSEPANHYLLYQGSVNEGRGFEQLIPAMKQINSQLHIYGDGNFMNQVKELIHRHGVGEKVVLHGYVAPEKLNLITSEYYMGITLFENTGLNQYYSLANRFFDYIQQCVPQVCMNYPEYRQINNQYEVVVLLDELSEVAIAKAVNELLENAALHDRLRSNCLIAREELNWQKEEKKLLHFYNQIFA